MTPLQPLFAALPAGSFRPVLTSMFVLQPQYKVDAMEAQVIQEVEVHIGTVAQQDVVGLQPGAEGRVPLGVVVRGLLDRGEGWQAAPHVQPQVQFRGRLPGPVIRPADAVERKLDRAGLDGMDGCLEAAEELPVFSSAVERRGGCDQIVEHLPVEGLRHLRIPRAVRVREGVALGWLRAPYARPLTAVYAGHVHDVVQASHARELADEQRHDMADG